ncbi:cbpA [Symbiodinium natans]|uniref:CbpA protein n=1 Tax=Symbiodinium natans TaxID=878477 RepID=A0A812L0I3_9DINO|nr:cbpA [Symbiodinium natans]
MSASRMPCQPSPDAAAAEAVLLAEIGPEAVQVLRPYYSALVGVADLARTAGGQQLRSLLRHIGELTCKVAALEDACQHWQAVCNGFQKQLTQVNFAQAAARQAADGQRMRSNAMQAQLLDMMKEHQAGVLAARKDASVSQADISRLHGELQKSQTEVAMQQEEIRRLRIELQAVGSQHRQRDMDLEAERLRAAGSDLAAAHAGQEKARLKATLRRVDDDQREQMEILSAQAQDEKWRLQQRLEAEHRELVTCRQAAGVSEAVLAEVRSLVPIAIGAVDFVRDSESPAMKLARGPVLLSANTSVRIPVLALRWGPGASLNSTPGWQAVREGLFALLHQLQSGATMPEKVELSVCEVDGRWFCCEASEAHRFAALLMYQVLHRDAPVCPTCRVTSAHKVLSIPKEDFRQHSGLSVMSCGAVWRDPPKDDEDFLRAFLVGSPLKEAMIDFLYHQRRNRVEDALQRETAYGTSPPFLAGHGPSQRKEELVERAALPTSFWHQQDAGASTSLTPAVQAASTASAPAFREGYRKQAPI